ncbi:UNVERIFIED_CONTAM: hypothetical protein Cloal_2339 [Acetivibrio alkalicellulosi]
MKKSLLRQFPRQIRERIADHTIESYELRDTILKLIDKKPMFIIRVYLKSDDLSDYLEEKDINLIKSKLNSVLTYEWFYFKFKKKIKEKMDYFIKEVAESFAYIILFENKYEYNEESESISKHGNYNINNYNELGDFMFDFETMLNGDNDYLNDIDNKSSFLDNIAINYLHNTLKQLLIDVYEQRKEEFIKFFKLEGSTQLNDRDFEELEYELFEFFDTEFPIHDVNNPVGSAEDLVSQILKTDVKLLFSLGKDGALQKNKQL